jgi:Type IV secretory pathway, TrbD component
MNKIYRFGWRPMLFMGADRELTIFLSLFCGIIIFYSFNIIVIIITIVIWFINMSFLKMMAKSDPQLRHIYRNHIKYKSIYLAKSSIFCKSNRVYK